MSRKVRIISDGEIRIEIESFVENDCFLSLYFNYDNIHKSFLDKITNSSTNDWYIEIDNDWYKMDFLNSKNIGNGDNIIADSILVNEIGKIPYEIKYIFLTKANLESLRDLKINQILSNELEILSMKVDDINKIEKIVFISEDDPKNKLEFTSEDMKLIIKNKLEFL